MQAGNKAERQDNVDQATFEAMAQRRGYIVERFETRNNLGPCRLLRGEAELTTLAASVIENRDVPRMAILFDDLLRMHHMACVRCQEPLLRTTNDAFDLARKDRDGHTMYYVYRSAKAGPTSSMLLRCPGCGSVLDVGTTQGIDDRNLGKALLDTFEEQQRRYDRSTRFRREMHGQWIDDAMLSPVSGEEDPRPSRPASFMEEQHRLFAGNLERQELTGEALTEVLTDLQEEGREPPRTLHLTWNICESPEEPVPTELLHTVRTANPYGLLSPAFLEPTWLPEQPNEVVLETILGRIMTGGDPHAPIDLAQITEEVEARQRFNAAMNKAEDLSVKEEARRKKQKQRQSRRNRAKARRTHRGLA